MASQLTLDLTGLINESLLTNKLKQKKKKMILVWIGKRDSTDKQRLDYQKTISVL